MTKQKEVKRRRLHRGSTARQERVKRRLYRRATAAALLDTSVSMLKRLERTGRLTVVKIGGRDVFYKAEEIEALASWEGE